MFQSKWWQFGLLSAHTRPIFLGPSMAGIKLAMAKKKPGSSFKLLSRAYLCIDFQFFFLENVVLRISNSAKKEFWKNIENCARETSLCKGPSESSNLFNHGRKKTGVPLQIGLTSLFMHRFPSFFLRNVVLQISNSAKKEFWKNIENCARETSFCKEPSESSNLFSDGKKKQTGVPLQMELTSLFMIWFLSFFLGHVVFQISNSETKKFWKNIENCARETVFCKRPSNLCSGTI